MRVPGDARRTGTDAARAAASAAERAGAERGRGASQSSGTTPASISAGHPEANLASAPAAIAWPSWSIPRVRSHGGRIRLAAKLGPASIRVESSRPSCSNRPLPQGMQWMMARRWACVMALAPATSAMTTGAKRIHEGVPRSTHRGTSMKAIQPYTIHHGQAGASMLKCPQGSRAAESPAHIMAFIQTQADWFAHSERPGANGARASEASPQMRQRPLSGITTRFATNPDRLTTLKWWMTIGREAAVAAAEAARLRSVQRRTVSRRWRRAPRAAPGTSGFGSPARAIHPSIGTVQIAMPATTPNESWNPGWTS